MGDLSQRRSENFVFEYQFLSYTTLPFWAIFESMSAIDIVAGFLHKTLNNNISTTTTTNNNNCY